MKSFAMAAMMLAASGCWLSTTTGITKSTGYEATSGGTSSGTGGSTGASTTGTGTGSSLGVGPCSSNDQCASGVCGIHGTGHCCMARCPSGDPPCAATDCDDQTGACVFPDAGVACGGVSCVVGDLLFQPGVCNGGGACAPNVTICDPYACAAEACLTSCQTNSQCANGYFCDAPSALCCTDPIADDTLYVDSVGGDDAQPCCGSLGKPPCRTIGRAMQIIDRASGHAVVIRATVDGGGGDWAPPGEVYPIVLGWGADLTAPGVHFTDQGKNREVIDVTAFSANDDVGFAGIVGSDQDPIWIGMDAAGNQTNDSSAISVEPGHLLWIANATVNGGGPDAGCGTAITVVGEASLVLGQDFSLSSAGTVHIGGEGLQDGCVGIQCQVDYRTDGGCTISDVDFGKSSVVIQGQEIADIDVEYSGTLVNNISLSASPVIGAAPSGPGFGKCGTKSDGLLGAWAVSLWAPTHMTFDNGTVQCIAGDAFHLAYTDAAGASLSLTMNNTTIQNADVGIDATDGVVTLRSSTLQYNHIGIWSDGEGPGGAIDISGADGGRNTVVCSSIAEAAPASRTGLLGDTPGIDVVNTAGVPLNASNVDWDTAGPDLFTCGSGQPPSSPWSCELSHCATSPGADGMDAVELKTGTITTTGNGVSSIVCWPPDGG